MFKLVVIIITFLSYFQFLDAQEIIEEAKIQFNLPNSLWKFEKKIKKKHTDIYWYYREKTTTIDGIEVRPFITVVVEELPSKMNILDYSKEKLGEASFKQKKMFINDDTLLAFSPAIGYLGTYNQPTGMEHTIYVIHLINNNQGVQMILDFPTELFSQYEKELRRVMQTITIQFSKKKKKK